MTCVQRKEGQCISQFRLRNKAPQTRNLKHRYLFSSSPRSWKSEIKVWTGLAPQAYLLGVWRATFSPVFTWLSFCVSLCSNLL